MTDAVLNRLARDGVRVRSYALSPGAVVPCAVVWDDDELMTLRLRADFGGASEFTLSQRVAGTEVVRVTGQVAASSQDELIFALPAAWVRQFPVVEVDLLLTAHEGDEERTVAEEYARARGIVSPSLLTSARWSVARALTSKRPLLDTAGSALTGRHLPAAREHSHLFGLSRVRLVPSFSLVSAVQAIHERGSP